MRDPWPLLRPSDFPRITRERLDTLQLNLGYLCNLSCIHCHVAAGPQRTELMDRATMQLALDVAQHHGVRTLDVTGGSPEMNPDFRWLIKRARGAGLHVMDRLNPTIMEEPGYEWVGRFLADNKVEAIASLPCYSQANVDEQRGKGVFDASIRALQSLNALGYGQQPDSDLVLNLVYNPNGAFLPPEQEALQADYKRLLHDNFGIVFNQLYALANMPIQRYGSWLLSKGHFASYVATLKHAHRAHNLPGVMCRSLISVDYQGYVYDCDFNQMLHLPLGAHDRAAPGARRPHLRDLLDGTLSRAIAVADHCYGCTAGQGSSCSGALT